jgi:hypothetical protein
VAIKPRSVARAGPTLKQAAAIHAPGGLDVDGLAQLLNRVQAELVSKLNPALQSPILAGVMKDVQLTASTPVDVEHGLGRAPLGWIVVGNAANSVVWASTLAKVQDKILTLNTSADTTVRLWIF